ncbi:MAG: hypothetical protein J1G02_02090 [Clostridiales bacterium]|nr:hypothetical protein [Clostridiales bacterium]
MTEDRIIAIVVISVLAFNFIWIVTQFIIYYISLRNQSKECLKVVYSTAFVWLCVVIELVGNALIVWLLASNRDNAPACGLIVFPFVGTMGITCSLNWQITVEDDWLVYRNYFRKVQRYHISEVTEMYLGLRGEIFVCIGREKIRLESCLTNRDKLLIKLSQNGVPTKMQERSK